MLTLVFSGLAVFLVFILKINKKGGSSTLGIHRDSGSILLVLEGVGNLEKKITENGSGDFKIIQAGHFLQKEVNGDGA